MSYHVTEGNQALRQGEMTRKVKAQGKWNGQVPDDDHAWRQTELPGPSLTACGVLEGHNDVFGLTEDVGSTCTVGLAVVTGEAQ